jgi:integrase
LQEIQHRSGGDGFVFPSNRTGLPLSNWTTRELVTDRAITVHGFRSTFRDWAAERTSYSNHAIEQSLAHVIGTAVERAYRRTDLFDQRRRLMDAWASYCTQPTPIERGEVVALRAG